MATGDDRPGRLVDEDDLACATGWQSGEERVEGGEVGNDALDRAEDGNPLSLPVLYPVPPIDQFHCRLPVLSRLSLMLPDGRGSFGGTGGPEVTRKSGRISRETPRRWMGLPTSGGKSILALEDGAVRELVVEMPMGFGSAVEQWVVRHRPGVVVSDLRMPRLDGARWQAGAAPVLSCRWY